MQTTIKIQKFTDLVVWQEGHKLVLMIYKTTRKFPKSEIFGLVSQMQRSAVSVTSNIAEGFGRRAYKERSHFYYIAQGSLTELKNQLLIARDIGYISDVDYLNIEEQANQTHRILQGFISKTNQFAGSYLLTPTS
ncbi:MAG: four helix bundle protein [Candidatus Paceibacterota bacterium]